MEKVHLCTWYIFFFFFLSVQYSIAVSFPKRCPFKSINAIRPFLADCSRDIQPQDFVCPLLRLEVFTVTSLPQSHRQRHLLLPTYSIAVSFPKRLPPNSDRITLHLSRTHFLRRRKQSRRRYYLSAPFLFLGDYMLPRLC